MGTNSWWQLLLLEIAVNQEFQLFRVTMKKCWRFGGNACVWFVIFQPVFHVCHLSASVVFVFYKSAFVVSYTSFLWLYYIINRCRVYYYSSVTRNIKHNMCGPIFLCDHCLKSVVCLSCRGCCKLQFEMQTFISAYQKSWCMCMQVLKLNNSHETSSCWSCQPTLYSMAHFMYMFTN